MRTRLLLDTGPLVALLNERDAFHAWSKEVLAEVRPPLLTCESVVSEACWLLRGVRGGREKVLELVARQIATCPFDLDSEAAAVGKLMRRYSDVPMSLADACLVRMAELDDRATVFTVDRDFRIYRAHGRRSIPVVMPPSR